MSINSLVCSSATEAARLLGSNPRARYFGGGTLVMRAINEGDQSFDTIIRINDPELTQMQIAGNRLVIGAGVTMSALLQHRDAGFLHAAARSVGGPAIRHMATVGGNLFAQSPYGDFATALLALDAEVIVADGSRMALVDFLARRNPSSGPTPVVTQVSVNRPASAGDFWFLKVSRVKPKGISVMSFAAHLPRAANQLQQVRVAVGAMAPTPVRMLSVEQALAGHALDAASIEAAARVALEGLTPPTDAIATNWYRSEVAPVHLKRLLTGAMR